MLYSFHLQLACRCTIGCCVLLLFVGVFCRTAILAGGIAVVSSGFEDGDKVIVIVLWRLGCRPDIAWSQKNPFSFFSLPSLPCFVLLLSLARQYAGSRLAMRHWMTMEIENSTRLRRLFRFIRLPSLHPQSMQCSRDISLRSRSSSATTQLHQHTSSHRDFLIQISFFTSMNWNSPITFFES